jgi:asparagine synthase (glutamine-hydrolysing)
VCGIGGILRIYSPGAEVPSPEASVPESWLDAIDEDIRHRGPDGPGRFRDRARRADGATVDVALVHRRMSIIDIGGGVQPMVSDRGTSDAEPLVAVVFNGCIYNHREIRRELEAAGRRFQSDHSDTEVFIHGWRQWNGRVLDRLEGMFAAAIWDRGRAMLVLARDMAGEKPLYMARPLMELGESMVFASTPGAVLHIAERLAPDPGRLRRRAIEARIARLQAEGADPARGIEIVPVPEGPPLNVPRRRIDLRHAELAHWTAMLAHDCGGPREARAGAWLATGWAESPPLMAVEELRPATVASSHNDDLIESGARFKPPRLQTSQMQPAQPLTPGSAESLLAQSVSERLEADVPLGCFLSGGIDSGLIAALAHVELQRRGQRLATFTMRMPSPEHDESAAAETTARHLGTQHTTFDCSPRVADDLLHLITQLGLPFGDSSLLPTYWLCKAAREHVKVALAGDGGDELFGGYDRYVAAAIIQRHHHALRLLPPNITPLLAPRPKRERVRRFLGACRYGYNELLRIFDSDDYRRLTGQGPWPGRWHAESPMSIDFNSYLPFDLLRKTDTASMAVALEVRCPFLSFGLVRSALGTPQDVLMPGGQRKGLLRAVARRHLPPAIIDRPKQGFAIPIGDWFRTDFGGMRTMLLDHLNAADPWPNVGVEINRRFVAQILDEHMGGRRDHSQRLYMLLVLSIWARATLV